MHTKIKTGSAAGYTLLELLLSLGLSVAVVSTIGVAIQIYLVGVTQQQSSIEQQQLARSVVNMIGNDLRAGIQYKAADYGGLETLIQTQLQIAEELGALQESASSEAPESAATAALQGSQTANPGSGTTSSTNSSSSNGEAPDSGIIDESGVAFRPTLVGTENVVMIDISRLPRLDQYNALIAGDQDFDAQSPSDVKSLAYFVSVSDGGRQSTIEFENQDRGGLYRREIDRAVAAFAGEDSIVDSPDENSQLVASEVSSISFRYFDGEQWQTQWDSGENGGFPVAIEVSVQVDFSRGASQSGSGSSSSNQNELQTYRSVISLPVGEPTAEEE